MNQSTHRLALLSYIVFLVSGLWLGICFRDLHGAVKIALLLSTASAFVSAIGFSVLSVLQQQLEYPLPAVLLQAVTGSDGQIIPSATDGHVCVQSNGELVFVTAKEINAVVTEDQVYTYSRGSKPQK